MVCKYCGKETPDEGMFCRHCGNKLEDTFVPPENIGYYEPENGDKAKKHKKKGIVISIVAFLIIVILVGLFFWKRPWINSLFERIEAGVTSFITKDAQSGEENATADDNLYGKDIIKEYFEAIEFPFLDDFDCVGTVEYKGDTFYLWENVRNIEPYNDNLRFSVSPDGSVFVGWEYQNLVWKNQKTIKQDADDFSLYYYKAIRTPYEGKDFSDTEKDIIKEVKRCHEWIEQYWAETYPAGDTMFRYRDWRLTKISDTLYRGSCVEVYPPDNNGITSSTEILSFEFEIVESKDYDYWITWETNTYIPLYQVIAEPNIQIYSLPDMDSEIIGTYDQHTVIYLSETKDNWGKVWIDGDYGWVSMDYLIKK